MSQHNPKPAEAVSNFEKLTGSYTQIESRLAAGELTRASAYEQASLMANSLQSMLSQTAAYFTSLIDQAQIQVIGAASSTVNQLFNFVSQLEATFGSTFYNPSQSFQTHASSQLVATNGNTITSGPMGPDRRVRSRKRHRPYTNQKRLARAAVKANEPFELSGPPPDLATTRISVTVSGNENLPTPPLPEEKVHFCQIPMHRQVDPKPEEIITTQETLNSYHRLWHGTCIIAPRDKPAFCKVKFIPFSSMLPDELLGWMRLVCFFFDRTNYVEPVTNNGPLMGGWMWADGWRKCSKALEAFGRYCCVGKLARMMRLARYDPTNEANSICEANDWISIQLQQFAPGVFEKYREVLINNNLPSMAHMEYQSTYNALDFSSFLTFTMYDFHNGPHIDTDANQWTLVVWIPIFDPRHPSHQDGQILADKNFDMTGGQFTFRDFQVYLDLNNTHGVTMCVFRSRDHTHQTLPGRSESGKYTRIGFSCQMSERMSHAVVSYLHGKNQGLVVAGQEVQNQKAEIHLAAKK